MSQTDLTAPSELSVELAARLGSLDWETMDKIAAADECRRQKQQADLASIRAAELRESLWVARGQRYRTCTLENFKVNNPLQRRVVEAIARYHYEIIQRIEAGMNILLTGRPGTGKDHLLAALMSRALEVRQSVWWISGTTLFREVRDAMTASRVDVQPETELELIRQYTWPHVLVISDPARANESLTRHQRDKLYEIIDARGNDRRAIWVSLNAQNREQANAMIGADNVDRLRDGALTCVCDWPSYRKPIEEVAT